MNFVTTVINHYQETRTKIDKQKFLAEILSNSIFVMDTNALVDPLKLQQKKEEVFSALEKISQKTYIPYVTQVEFLDLEKDIVQDAHNIISTSKKIVENIQKKSELINSEDIKDSIRKNLLKERQKKEINENNYDFEELAQKTDEYANQLEVRLETVIKEAVDKLKDEIKKKKSELKSFDWSDAYPHKQYDETIKEDLLKWLDSVRLGAKYSESELNSVIEKIEVRYQKEISPGYKDSGKKGEIIRFGSSIVARKYSDALFWLDSLNYIKNELSEDDFKYLVIVSNEIKKDWVEDAQFYKLNEDMIRECIEETGLLPIKINFKTMLEYLSELSDDELDNIIIDDFKYSFTLYGEVHTASSQAQMQRLIFEKILSRVNGREYLEIPCIKLENDETWFTNSTFNSNYVIKDRNKVGFRIGTSLNLPQKLRYIFELLELRVTGSSPQLKFVDEEVQKQWEDICQKKSRK